MTNTTTPEKSAAWTTGDELRFIHKLEQRVVPLYLAGIERRVEWNGLDRQTIIDAALDRLPVPA